MAKYIINADIEKSVIDKNIYGNFSEHLGRCIYEGMFVGKDSDIPNVNGMRTDVVEALKEMKLPLLRWPGGCFADTYHWKDGIGPLSERKKIQNIHWGGVIEDNSFGTHEFFEFCRQVGCEPYICGNLGSGTVQEMQEWVDYINNDALSPMSDLRKKNGQEKAWTVKYWGVGNENWGCGGNMSAEYYANEFKRYATYLYNYGNKPLYKIACGPCANASDFINTDWTETLMHNVYYKRMSVCFEAIAMHYYCGDGGGGKARNGNDLVWHEHMRSALMMDKNITRNSVIMDKYDPKKEIALAVDEWGAWYAQEDGSQPGFLYQQNTLRDAVIAGLTLNIFNKHSDRVRMANIAQMVNVLQAVLLTDGKKMVKTPTYYAFKMYADHQNATLLDSTIEAGTSEYKGDSIIKLNESASKNADGVITSTVCNLDPHDGDTINCEIRGKKITEVKGEIIVSDDMNDCNEFDKPEVVFTKPLSNIKITDNGFTAEIPAKCVVKFTIK